MKLTYEKFADHLSTKLHSIYFFHGEEPLLIEELVDHLSVAAMHQGFDSIKRIQVTPNFKWKEFLDEFKNQDLFAEKTYIKVTMPTGKPGTVGSKALIEYMDFASEDCLLVIISEKLDGSTLKSNWYQAIEKHGVTVQVRKLQNDALLSWLRQRFLKVNLKISSEALELFADKTLGNLLAAQQEIEKMSLIYGEAEISSTQIEEVMIDHAHFDIFNLSNAWLQDNTKEYLRILRQLKAQGIASTLILWALTREARQAAQIAFRINQGENLSQALQTLPAFRRPLVQHHIKNHDQYYYHQFLEQCAVIDRVIKGVERGDEWLLFEKLILSAEAVL